LPVDSVFKKCLNSKCPKCLKKSLTFFKYILYSNFDIRAEHYQNLAQNYAPILDQNYFILWYVNKRELLRISRASIDCSIFTIDLVWNLNWKYLYTYFVETFETCLFKMSVTATVTSKNGTIYVIFILFSCIFQIFIYIINLHI